MCSVKYTCVFRFKTRVKSRDAAWSNPSRNTSDSWYFWLWINFGTSSIQKPFIAAFFVIAHFISWNPYEVTAHSSISYGLRWKKAQQQYLLGSSENWGSDPSIHLASWALANAKTGRDKRMACLSLLTPSLSSRCYHKVQGEILPQRSRQRMVEEDTQLLWEGRLLVASCLAPK